MLKTRIIPRLDIKGPNLVKGVHLEGLRVLGLPERFSNNYSQDGADELIYIDTVASLYGRNNLEGVVRRTAKNVFVPITVGGGIRSIDDIRLLLRAGADKVAINTAAIKNPTLISEGAKMFGSQCIVVSIQAMRASSGKYEAYTDNGRESTGKDVFEWVKHAVDLGAGEILITSIDQEGTGEGYDIELVAGIVESISVPVIACGGAGNVKHFEEVIRQCNVDAVCAASIFHYHFLKKFGVEKREEGNVEYLKSLFEKETFTLKKLQTTSVSGLKTYLSKIDSSYCKSEQEKIENNIQIETNNKWAKLVIIDYGLCNLFSVESAFKSIGANVEITNDLDKIKEADGLIIAGVGAFSDGMKYFWDNGLVSSIKYYAVRNKPILGICLGMQLFMSRGEEFGLHEGLCLISGKVTRLQERDDEGIKVKVPHIGWSCIKPPCMKDRNVGSNDCGWPKGHILHDIDIEDSFYFLHSYVVSPKDLSLVVAETNHGTNTFCSVIKKGNIVGCQFHPERSGVAGLKIFKNFVDSI